MEISDFFQYGVSRRGQCFFTIHNKSSDGLYEFRSAVNKDWIVNFRKDGKPSRYTGKRNRRWKKSALFMCTVADIKPLKGTSGKIFDLSAFINVHNNLTKTKQVDIRDGNRHRVRHLSNKMRRMVRRSRTVISSTNTAYEKPTFEKT